MSRFVAIGLAIVAGAVGVGRFEAVRADEPRAEAKREQEAAYPQAQLLIEPADLAQTQQTAKTDPAAKLVVLDARPAEQFAAGHVPGARWVDHVAWSKGFGQGTDAAGWSRRIGELGISADSTVVVYDDNLAKDAARIWWILRYWNVNDARLLHGGWRGWQTAKLPVEKEKTAFTPVEFQATPRDERLATKKELLAGLPVAAHQIVDARSEKEFCGVDKQNNKRAGAIPGATHLEWSDLLNRETQRFKSAGELERLFRQAGVSLDRPTVTHCQGGGRAAVMAFGLELMGAKEVGNYYASWGEWGNAEDTPVEPGKPAARDKQPTPKAPAPGR
ncbi:MAG TPA: sulfurtransferase [Pirellulales bacterium]